MIWHTKEDALPQNGEEVPVITTNGRYVVLPYWNGFNRRGERVEKENDECDMTEYVLYWAELPPSPEKADE